MPNTKVTSLGDIASTPANNDVYPIVDVSDTSMAGTGTTKKIQAARILHTNGTANTLGANLSLNNFNLTSGGTADFTAVTTNTVTSSSLRAGGVAINNLAVEPLTSFTSVTRGLLLINNSTNGSFAFVQVMANLETVVIIRDDLNAFSNTAATASKINVYFASGAFRVENRIGSAQFIQLIGLGI